MHGVTNSVQDARPEQSCVLPSKAHNARVWTWHSDGSISAQMTEWEVAAGRLAIKVRGGVGGLVGGLGLSADLHLASVPNRNLALLWWLPATAITHPLPFVLSPPAAEAAQKLGLDTRKSIEVILQLHSAAAAPPAAAPATTARCILSFSQHAGGYVMQVSRSSYTQACLAACTIRQGACEHTILPTTIA